MVAGCNMQRCGLVIATGISGAWAQSGVSLGRGEGSTAGRGYCLVGAQRIQSLYAAFQVLPLTCCMCRPGRDRVMRGSNTGNYTGAGGWLAFLMSERY